MNPILKKLLNVIHAEEENGRVYLRGLRVHLLALDIKNLWSTSKIESNIFIHQSRHEIVFTSFFVPDIHYVLTTLLAQAGTRRLYSAPDHLRQAIVALETGTWFKRVMVEPQPQFDYRALDKFHKKPLPHQMDFFKVYDEKTQRYGLNGYLLYARPGAGKTICSLMTAEMCGADHIVVVSPKNAIETVWQHTAQHEYKSPQSNWVIAHGKPYRGERILISHYETLDKLLPVVVRLKGKVFVVLDECHNFNDIDSLRTRLFVKLCHDVAPVGVIWSSGTPIKAIGYEAVPMLRTLDPLFDDESDKRFRKVFGRDAKRALDILRNRMGMVTFKVESLGDNTNQITERVELVSIPNGMDYTVDAVKLEMQRYIDERLRYYQSNFQQMHQRYRYILGFFEETLRSQKERDDYTTYNRAVREISTAYDPVLHKELVKWVNGYELRTIIPRLPQEYKAEFKELRSVIKYVRLKVIGEALGGVLGRKRAELHVAMVEHLPLQKWVDQAHTKTLIFTSYVQVLKAVEALFRKIRYRPVVIYGETNKDLPRIVKQFAEDADLNPAIATYMSLSTAVPMTMASTAVFLNQPFRDHEKKQARARLDRIGQAAPITFIDVLLDTGGRPNISTRSSDILEWSRQQVEAIMGSGEWAEDTDIGPALEAYAATGMEDYFTPNENRFEAAFESIIPEIISGNWYKGD